MRNGIKPGMMKYCVIGNIVMEHPDKDGILRHGTASFPGGRKVYISRRLWDDGEVTIMGLNRLKSRYVTERVPLSWLENIRFSKTFEPRVLELMVPNFETVDMWWRHKEEDRIGATEYAKILNRVKAGDREAYEQYYREIMYHFEF